MTDSQGRLIPMVTCIGNHEVAGQLRQDKEGRHLLLPALRRSVPGDQLRDARLLATTSAWSSTIRDTPRRSAASRRSGWTRRSPIAPAGPDLIAVNHVPCYPSYRVPEGKGGKFGTGEEQRKNWVPLFDKHNIDLVLEHHDHTFKRTHPMRGGEVDERTGIVYLGDGSWGKLRIPKMPEKPPYLAEASAIVPHDASSPAGGAVVPPGLERGWEDPRHLPHRQEAALPGATGS